MMRWLLDTNVCIEILRGRHAGLKQRLMQKQWRDLSICSVVWAELHCGARLANNPKQEQAKLQAAFGSWSSLPFDDRAAEAYGAIRALLQRSGQIIGGNDLMIAAIALSNDLTLVTHNVREFSRVPGLSIEDWQQ